VPMQVHNCMQSQPNDRWNNQRFSICKSERMKSNFGKGRRHGQNVAEFYRSVTASVDKILNGSNLKNCPQSSQPNSVLWSTAKFPGTLSLVILHELIVSTDEAIE